jgi:hypothetical protein
MLKAAVDDGPKDFGLEQEIPESGAVDGHVVSLDLLLGSSGGTGSSVGGSRGDSVGLLLLLVVQKLSVVLHCKLLKVKQ